MVEWQERRDEQLRIHPKCQGPGTIPDECWGPITVHHITPRGMGGTANDNSLLITLCAWHHGWVESHRAQAREMGLLTRRPHEEAE